VYSFPVSLDQAQQELASLLGTQAQASIDLPHS
jgi:hypothetical protein